MSRFAAGLESLRARLAEPVDPASIALYRIAFGTVMSVSAIRFLALGWVDRCFVHPRFFFHYYGFSFVEPLGREGMIAVFVALALLAAMVAVGLFYRVAIVLYFLLFTYVELIDVTNYLNHYYLVSLLALLLAFVPANAAYSLDARLGLVPRGRTIAAGFLYLLRFQVGVVYFYAAVAKIGSDWLLHGEPLQIWMASRADTPILGPLLSLPGIPLAMSWAGFLNDLLAVPLLLGRKTRPFGFAMILAFHAATNVFFHIGIFPILMPINATLFFDPDWPRRLLGRRQVLAPDEPPRSAPRLVAALLVVHCVVQAVFPLRTFLYGGNVLWHEQGMRFSWRVMLRKKTGSVTYVVRLPSEGRTVHVHPRRYLDTYQEQEFAAQPDLILQLAHVVADEFRAKGHPDVEVRADALVSLNGRPPSRLIDPSVDLARVRDGVGAAHYILPAPEGPPAHLGMSRVD